MPASAAFLKGFGISKGVIISGFELVAIKIRHVQVERYRRYRYPMTLIFEGDGDPKSLLTSLKRKTQTSRVIYSQYGNPYRCTFGSPSIEDFRGDKVTITSEGVGRRIRL